VYGGTTEAGEESWILINSVGNGFMLVTDSGGDLEVGDFLASSPRAGYGQRQEDDLLHTHTVGKAMMRVRWADVAVDPAAGFKWKLVACTFKAG
jgi:hypothetical protein